MPSSTPSADGLRVRVAAYDGEYPLRRSYLLFVLISALALLAARPSAGQEYRGRLRRVIPERRAAGDAIELRAREISMWTEDGVRVFEARGDVELVTPESQLVAGKAIIFFEEGYAAKAHRIIVRIYAEDHVTLWERGRELRESSVYRTYETDVTFLVDDADHQIAELESPALTPAYRRAIVAKARTFLRKPAPEPPPGEGVTPETPPTELVEGEKPVKVEPVIVAPPKEGVIAGPDSSLRTQIFATQSAGYQQHVIETEDELVVTLTGGIDILLSSEGGKDFEITAENAVVWFYKRPGASGLAAFENLVPKAVYAEGNVVLYRERLRFRAPRLVHDFQMDKSLIYDAVARTEIVGSDIPVYYRASVIRQVTRDLFIGYDAMITNSASPHPGVYFTTTEFELERIRAIETVETDQGPQEKEVVAHQVATTKNNVIHVHGLPLTYWPMFKKDMQDDTFALRKLRLSQSSRYGTSLETAWDLNDLGVPEMAGVELHLLLDYFSRRGPAVGVQSDYARDGGEGSFLGYYLYDIGEDANGFEPPRKQRGRIHWLHRQHLSEADTLDFELSWLSDEGFLREYFEDEDKTEKEQETIIYYKHQRDKWAATGLGRWRLNDWYDRTEYLPQLGFNVVGLSLPGDWLTFHSDNEVANLRNRTGPLRGATPRHRIFRADSNNEITMPLSIGPVEMTPFLEGRVSYFDDSQDGDSHYRYAGAFGFRANTRFHKIYDVYNRLLDVNRIRHIIVPELEYRNLFNTSQSERDLFPFDEVDTVNEFQVISLGLRQRFQTKRGRRVLAGEDIGKRRIIDLLTVDIELDLFPHKSRDNAGQLSGPLQITTEAYVTDTVTFYSDIDFDMNDGHTEIFNLGFTIDRYPRMRFYVGNHYVRAGGSNAWNVVWEYRATPRWDIRVASQYDFSRDVAIEHEFTVRRYFQAWMMDLSLAVDQGENDTVASIVFAPRGIPDTRFKLRAW